ncbi:MAG: coenzyme F420-0:L-glutamate ligase [Clostridia bacterium]|nr:coenzyme F420-0:L-glutamate ligase [Clostridia bacterium]
MRTYGTCAFGVRAPIIRPGDDLVEIAANSVMAVAEEKNIKLKEKDIVAVTEAIVAKSQGNFAKTSDIADDVRAKLGDGKVGLIFPILSRNRFSEILKGISDGVDELVIQLSYPFDEVGNPLVSIDKLYELGIYTFDRTFTPEEFYEIVGSVEHPFTGVDYIKYYLEICGGKASIILSNDPLEILKYTKKVINADIHSRFRTKKLLEQNGAEKVLSLSDILSEESTEHGYHESYGVLGSNKSKDGMLKLFPRNTQEFVEKLQEKLKEKTGVTLECMVYGDGAFKDPVGGIWELADPVVSPAFTSGLVGTPNEIKLKYVADNKIENLSGEEAVQGIKEIIKQKEGDLKNQNISLGTTPRRITDLVGSLCDLTSGSGDKGTPIVLITGYFDNYADE